MGKPIIIPNTNIAHYLQHLENALILPVVDQESLPKAIDLLVDNPDLAQKIGQQGLEFALTNLNWGSSTKKLVSFYEALFAPEKQLNSVTNVLKRVRFHHFQELATLQQTKNKVEELQNLNDNLNSEMMGMKTSKFWKIRKKWFKLKHLIGFQSN